MKVIQKVLELSPQSYYETHLNIINGILPARLTNKEVQVLAAFMSADPKLTEDDRFNSLVRKKVMKDLELSPGGLGNHLESMIKKGFLTKSKITKRIRVKEYLEVGDTRQGYQFIIKKKDE